MTFCVAAGQIAGMDFTSCVNEATVMRALVVEGAWAVEVNAL